MSRLAALVAGVLLVAGDAGAATIVYTDFSSLAGLQLNGAAAQVDNVLRLTPAAPDQSGSAFSTSAIALLDDYSFSTFFTFRITSSDGARDEDGAGADGLTFIIQTNSSLAGASGGGIGYEGVLNSFAVEYDTFNNFAAYGDPDGNHLGVDLGGNIDSAATASVSNRMNNGQIWYSWIDYDGATDVLEVRIAEIDVRPAAAQLTYVVDLGLQLGMTSAFVGFGSGTGEGWGHHDILSWEFRDTFAPIQSFAPTQTFAPVQSQMPEPASVALLGAGLLVLGLARRRRRQRAG